MCTPRDEFPDALKGAHPTKAKMLGDRFATTVSEPKGMHDILTLMGLAGKNGLCSSQCKMGFGEANANMA